MNVWFKKTRLLLCNVPTFTGSDSDAVVYPDDTKVEDIIKREVAYDHTKG